MDIGVVNWMGFEAVKNRFYVEEGVGGGGLVTDNAKTP